MMNKDPRSQWSESYLSYMILLFHCLGRKKTYCLSSIPCIRPAHLFPAMGAVSHALFTRPVSHLSKSSNNPPSGVLDVSFSHQDFTLSAVTLCRGGQGEGLWPGPAHQRRPLVDSGALCGDLDLVILPSLPGLWTHTQAEFPQITDRQGLADTADRLHKGR